MRDLQKAPWPGWNTIRLIGQGSFGTVYEIRRELIDGTVEAAAMKVLTIPQNPSDVTEMYSEGYDEESITATFQAHLRSIVAEYTLMRKLDGSANVVNCKDISYIQHDDGIGWDIYIRMELLTPLLKALPENVPEETVVRLGRDIASALVLCRKHSIIHRDIKPQNIFISDNADYKLGDFGIAKTVEKTMGGTKIGTYKYMAPEVYNNRPYGGGADIYSLGLVLYWLLNARRMPFMPLPPAKILAGQDEQARQRRLSGEKLPPPAHGSRELKRIVLKACAYDPNDRYHTADEMLEELEALGGEDSEDDKTAGAYTTYADTQDETVGTQGVFGTAKTGTATSAEKGKKAQSFDRNFVLAEAKIVELLEAAKKLHESNQYTKELSVLAEAYKFDQNNSLIMVQLGRCYRALNYPDKALEFYSKAVEINPNEGTAYTNMGTIHLLRGEYKAAKKCYEKGMPFIDKGEFDYWIAQANYAVAIAKLGDVKKAEKMISEAEAKGYSNGDAIRQMAGIKKKSLFSHIFG